MLHYIKKNLLSLIKAIYDENILVIYFILFINKISVPCYLSLKYHFHVDPHM